jgi:hypothetical protein
MYFHIPIAEFAATDLEQPPRYDGKETKRILRKVDYRLLPMLTLLYVLAFLDRGNIGNAKVAGMNKELNLTGTQYNIALTVSMALFRTSAWVLTAPFFRSSRTPFLKCPAIFILDTLEFQEGGGMRNTKEGLRDEEHKDELQTFIE